MIAELALICSLTSTELSIDGLVGSSLAVITPDNKFLFLSYVDDGPVEDQLHVDPPIVMEDQLRLNPSTLYGIEAKVGGKAIKVFQKSGVYEFRNANDLQTDYHFEDNKLATCLIIKR